MADRLCAYLDSLDDVKEPVVRLLDAPGVRRVFEDAGVPLSLAGDQPALGPDKLLEATDLLLRYSVRTGHPLFYNQLYGRADPVSIAADWASVATNTNCHTYEVAPVYTVMEHEVLEKISGLIGGPFAEAFDGLFVPGGSISNLYAMHLARHRADPDFLTRGAYGGPRCVAFTSDQAHYSYLKSSRLTGLGAANCVAVASDEHGRMLPAALAAAVDETVAAGGLPFFVGSTAGTTVLGAYDPFAAISEICAAHGMWHHVDACWGGGAMLSPRWQHLTAGVETADSVAWNPHKMSGTALQCSAFVTQHTGLLAAANGTSAAYLFQPDKLHTELDTGDKTIQCGRKTDVLKLWLQWKAHGDDGMAATVDRCFDIAGEVADRIRDDTTGAWQLVYEPSCTNVCFWYVPRRLRPFDFSSASKDEIAALHAVAPRIKNEMQRRGDAMIGFQAVNDRPNFFRLVIASADRVDASDLHGVLDRIAEAGEEEG